MRRLLLPLAFTIVIALCSFVAAAGRDDAPDREALARVTYLIEMLASKNVAPVEKGNAKMGEDVEIKFSKGYDKSLQVPVYLAAQQLLAEGEGALDLLLTHVGDKRYAFSVNSGNRDYNVSVSEACQMIAGQILLPFDSELHFITRSQGDAYRGLRKVDEPLAKWWAKNKRRGLRTLQVEAIDAMIAYMKTVDRKTASTVHPDAPMLPSKEFNKLREENLRLLQSTRRFIVEKGEPYRAKSLDNDHRCIFGLPWVTRHHNK